MDLLLVTGASGYVGGLAAAALLDSEASLVLPVRPPHNPASIRRHLEDLRGAPLREDQAQRLRVSPLSDALKGQAPRSVFHCAGSLSYFNKKKLEAANVSLTSELLERCRAWGVERFMFVSTAFSCGYRDDEIPEVLHPDPELDPTEYTASKRRAERLVAESGLPCTILRPSVVVGHSQTGRYHGKPYGIYQLWTAARRLLLRRPLDVLHLVAPAVVVPMIHADAFQSALLVVHRQGAPGPVLHLTSRESTSPTLRDLWDLWVERVGHPREVHYYARLEDLPQELPKELRVFQRLSEVNTEIASRRWRIETRGLEALRAAGCPFEDVTLASIERCQDAYYGDPAATGMPRSASRRPQVIEHFT